MGIISLFSGCGGCSFGLQQAGFNVDLAVDIDQDACETYSRNLNSIVWQTDLSITEPAMLLEQAGLRIGEVDLIVGGPPCQGFSSAGARDWNDPRNTLIRKYVELITWLRPTWFVMENVEGLLTANNGFFIIEPIIRFLEAGYWVRAKKVYMEQHGIPQKRKRVIIVGNLEQCKFNFPEPDHFDQAGLPDFTQLPQLSIMDAISDLPPAEDLVDLMYINQPQNAYQQSLRRLDGEPINLHLPKKLSDSVQQRINLLGQGETMKHLPEELQHPSYTRRSKRRVMDGTPTEKRGGAPSGLKRLIAKDPSLTMTSASPTEFIHPFENRPLTLRECARIQSIPDWYEFSGSWGSIATQIGNAIPPLFMQVLASHINSLATWRRVEENTRGYWLGIDATKSAGKSPALSSMLAELEEKTYAYANL